MKYSQLVAVLTAAGCYFVRHGGKHDIWYSPITNKHFQMPRHGAKEIPIGTERSIKKSAGL